MLCPKYCLSLDVSLSDSVNYNLQAAFIYIFQQKRVLVCFVSSFLAGFEICLIYQWFHSVEKAWDSCKFL